MFGHRGFGVYDVLEVVLGYTDEAIKILAAAGLQASTPLTAK